MTAIKTIKEEREEPEEPEENNQNGKIKVPLFKQEKTKIAKRKNERTRYKHQAAALKTIERQIKIIIQNRSMYRVDYS